MKSTVTAGPQGGRRSKMTTVLILRRAKAAASLAEKCAQRRARAKTDASGEEWQLWRRAVIVRLVIGVTVAMVLLIGIARGLKAGEWMLQRRLPNQSWQQRGPLLDQRQACETALASDGSVVPSGTLLRCERVLPAQEATK